MEIVVKVYCKACGFGVYIDPERIDEYRARDCPACGASTGGFGIKVFPESRVWRNSDEVDVRF